MPGEIRITKNGSIGSIAIAGPNKPLIRGLHGGIYFTSNFRRETMLGNR